jgi:hypothetical protein
MKEKNDIAALHKIAKSCIISLYRLSPQIVGYLINENGEIVVGDEVVGGI